MYRFDPRHFDLCARARWVEAGKPLHFSVLGHSVIGQAFQRADPNRYRTDRPLWREGSTDKWLEMDNRFHGAFTQAEGRVLLASVAPCPLPERAAAAGVDVDVMRAIRRRAMALV